MVRAVPNNTLSGMTDQRLSRSGSWVLPRSKRRGFLERVVGQVHLATSLSQAFEYGLLEVGHTLTQAADAGLKLLDSFIEGCPDFFDLVLNVGQSLGFGLLQGGFQGFLLLLRLGGQILVVVVQDGRDSARSPSLPGYRASRASSSTAPRPKRLSKLALRRSEGLMGVRGRR